MRAGAEPGRHARTRAERAVEPVRRSDRVRSDIVTVAETLDKLEQRVDDAETIYTLPVTDRARVLVGVVSLRDLLKAPRDAVIADIAGRPDWAYATEDSEQAARRCADLKRLALPVVDSETRLVGIFTFDDALRILEDSDSEDQARISGTEPLRQPYLATPVFNIVRSRVVWLLVLAIGASLTVQVLEVFEATLGQMVALALFIPLLIGTGGNTGNQFNFGYALGVSNCNCPLRQNERQFQFVNNWTKLQGNHTIKFGATVTLIDEDTDKKQVWQIVAYVESMSGYSPLDSLPGRSDRHRQLHR